MSVAMPDLPTGAELVGALRAHALRAGISAAQVARAFSGSPQTWLRQLEHVAHPKPITVRRVRAVLEGRKPEGMPAKCTPRPRNIHTPARQPNIAEETLPPRVFRDPCPRCGVRMDVGCAHLFDGRFR